MRFIIIFAALIAVAVLALQLSPAKEIQSARLRAVGSSTVYPFITLIAENFGDVSPYSTPIVEATGTGGGIKLFCAGTAEDTPSIVNASRQMKAGEKALCAQHGVTDIAEFMLGYDGIVLANKRGAAAFILSTDQIFLSLAQTIAVDGTLQRNPYTHWNQIDARLPSQPISVYGPPPTSGTRDAFVELALLPACVENAAFIKAFPEKKQREKQCALVREDGAFVEVGENDNLILQKLQNNETALGIFGYSFLEQNAGLVQAAQINGVSPDFTTIRQGKYTLARPLYVYVKQQHRNLIPGLRDFLEEMTSHTAIGEEGYTLDIGLIPLSAEKISQAQQQATHF